MTLGQKPHHPAFSYSMKFSIGFVDCFTAIILSPLSSFLHHLGKLAIYIQLCQFEASVLGDQHCVNNACAWDHVLASNHRHLADSKPRNPLELRHVRCLFILGMPAQIANDLARLVRRVCPLWTPVRVSPITVTWGLEKLRAGIAHTRYVELEQCRLTTVERRSC